MITLFQAILLGLVQGITELFPVSSLGHSVLIPGLLGWNIDQNANEFLTFLVATHFATALVLFVIYFKDWLRILRGIWRSVKQREISSFNLDGKLGWFLVAGTIPAGIVGLLFEKKIQKFFLSPFSAAVFLILNGILLYGAELLRRKAKTSGELHDADKRIADELTWWKSLKIGVIQVIALIPGFSRTGSTVAGGLLSGLSHEDALRYSFLLATPIIGAAAVLKLPHLLISGGSEALQLAGAGAVAAAIAAYFSVKFLTRYFKTRTLTPFAIYCVLLGGASLYLLSR